MLALAFLLFSIPANALDSHVQVEMRCTAVPYFKIENKVSYFNANIPFGAKVLVRSAHHDPGYQGDGIYFPRDWVDPKVTEIHATALNTWSGVVESLGALQFVFEIQLPNGGSYIDNGSNSRWGRYELTWDLGSPNFPLVCEQPFQTQPITVRQIN